jgi:hypothetical protein
MSLVAMCLTACGTSGAINSPARSAGAEPTTKARPAGAEVTTKAKPSADAYDPEA